MSILDIVLAIVVGFTTVLLALVLFGFFIPAVQRIEDFMGGLIPKRIRNVVAWLLIVLLGLVLSFGLGSSIMGY